MNGCAVFGLGGAADERYLLGHKLPSASVPSGLKASAMFCLGLLAAFNLLWSSVGVWKAQQSLNWTKVEGTIVTAETWDGGKAGFCFEVAYTYKFEGGSFSGITRTLGGRECGSWNWVKELARSYVAGAQVDVYVNPNNIFESVLLPGKVETSVWRSMGLSLFFSVLGIWAGLAAVRKGQHA
jgi:hypothetical protein